MNEQTISRRKLFTLASLAVATAVAIPAAVLTASSEAEAQNDGRGWRSVAEDARSAAQSDAPENELRH